jgi:hypothetical protein
MTSEIQTLLDEIELQKMEREEEQQMLAEFQRADVQSLQKALIDYEESQARKLSMDLGKLKEECAQKDVLLESL